MKSYETFKNNAKTKIERQTASWKLKIDQYNRDMETLFDIYCTDKDARRKRGDEIGVHMNNDDMDFYNDMKGTRRMFCEDKCR